MVQNGFTENRAARRPPPGQDPRERRADSRRRSPPHPAHFGILLPRMLTEAHGTNRTAQDWWPRSEVSRRNPAPARDAAAPAAAMRRSACTPRGSWRTAAPCRPEKADGPARLS